MITFNCVLYFFTGGMEGLITGKGGGVGYCEHIVSICRPRSQNVEHCCFGETNFRRECWEIFF